MFTPMKRLILFFCLLGGVSTASAAGIYSMFAVYLNQSSYTVRLTELSNHSKVTEVHTAGSFKTPKVLGKIDHKLELLDDKGAIFKTIQVKDPDLACSNKWHTALDHILQPEYTAISLDRTDPSSSWNTSVCLSGIGVLGEFIGLKVTITNDGIVLEQGKDENILQP
ncbi:MAG: hypothetical protein ACRC4G_05625 [Alphaproteobacteria bacterium]